MPRALPSGMIRRGRVYYACFRAHGRRVAKRLSGDLSTAKELLNDLKSRADKAEFGIVDNNVPLAEIRAKYEKVTGQTLRPRTVKRYRQCLATILSTFPALAKARDVTIDAMAKYREERLAGVVQAAYTGKRPKGRKDRLPSPRSVNMEVGALSTMLTWAASRGIKLIGSNPIQDLDPLPEDEKRKERRSLTVGECEALFKVAPEHRKQAYRMFLTTAIRRDELVEMKFADVDFEAREVTVRGATAKNHKAREIPLDDEMLATLQALKDAAKHRQAVPGTTARMTAQLAENLSRDHVFVTTANTPWRNNLLTRFYSDCRKAGIEGAEPGGSVDLHSLRGTTVTLAIDGGASPKAVQAILGHSTLALTMNTYAKSSSRSKRAAIGAIPFAKVSEPDHVAGVIGGQGDRMTPSSAPDAQAKAGAGVA